MNKRRITSTVMLLVVWSILMAILTGCATEEIPIPTVQSNVYIYDEDNVIDDVVEEKLNRMLVELEEKTGAEFAVISVESLLNRTVEEYANQVFNTLGIGKDGEDNGVLLLFSQSDTRVRLEVGRGLEGCLNDAKCGKILDDYFVPYRDNDEYTKATELTVQAVLSVIAEEYQIEIQDLEKTLPEEENDSTDVVILLVILGLVIIAALFAMLGGFSDSGGSSGGSFGGGSSGGSFSGGSFGGGFSAGGGASR